MDDTKYSMELRKLQSRAFNYFLNEANPDNGLIIEKTAQDWPASLAATGLALTAYPVAVECGFIQRQIAKERTLSTLRFFRNSRQAQEPEATGYKGFYYSALDMQTGRRARMSELSVMDSSIFIAGALAAASYFDHDNQAEAEIRAHADELFRRADWQWALDGGLTLKKGWKPETGFSGQRFHGYDGAILAYIMGLGSPSFPLGFESYSEWTSTFEWINSYGYDYLYAGPLLAHQIAHVWIDFRGIQDMFMRSCGTDYFENSARATIVQKLYAIDNPGKFQNYGKNCWGITLSDGPGPLVLSLKGEERKFFGYMERGAPYGPDDGTVSPWAAIASLPFVPETVFPLVNYCLSEPDLNNFNLYGFKASFNPSYPHKEYNPHGWKSPWHYGIIQGPAISMIENYKTGLIWELMRNNPHLIKGLKKAGFTGGWLKKKTRNVTAELSHIQK